MSDGSRRVARFRVVGIVLLCQGDDRPSGRVDCRSGQEGLGDPGEIRQPDGQAAARGERYLV